MKVVFAPEALEDLTATIEHIAQDDPRAATRLADRVFEMIDQLAEGGLDHRSKNCAPGRRSEAGRSPHCASTTSA